MDSNDQALYVSPEIGFARLAATYDARLSGNPVLLLETTQALMALPNVAQKRVGDIGCGTGRYAMQLVRLGAAQVVGIDLSREMLEIAQRKAHQAELPIEFGLGDLRERLPLPDGALDAAICALTLTFLSELRPVFIELARVLATNGILVISELHPFGLMQARAALEKAFRRDRAPYLRFTDSDGAECRIARTPHALTDYVTAAVAAGFTLDQMAEPLVDSRLAATFPLLSDQIGLPLALILRFRKSD
jgi:ubiquinone/menaquinone biosynthesis C-methylase UbiE